MPVSEVRGAIPLVIALAETPLELVVGLSISTISNMLVPFVVFKLLDFAEKLVFCKWTPGTVRRLYSYILSLGRSRSTKLRRASYAALALFVGIPLPVTGAWTGTLVAYVIGMNRRRATLAIIVGVVLASFIVTLASLVGFEVLKRVFML